MSTTETHGTTFAFGVKGLGTGAFTVSAFHGKEGVSRLFSFDVTLVVDDADRAAMSVALLGQVAWLVIDHPDAPRTVEGIIAEASAGAALTAGRGGLRVRLVPRLWLLKRRKNSRIFQDVSLVEIIDAVLSEHGVAREWRIAKKPPVRAYTVQYHETDYAFVTRLLAEEGIAFSIESQRLGEATGGRVIFFDHMAVVPPIDGDESLAFRVESPALTPEENHVHELSLSRSIKNTRVLLRDYDFERPLLDLSALATAGVESRAPGELVGTLDVHEHEGDYHEVDVTEDKARVHLEQRRRRSASAHGRTPCRRLLPGRRFTLIDHELGTLNQPYLITATEHTGSGVLGGAGGSETRYQCRFQCVPVTGTVRPKRPRRVLKQVVETATVTGPLGSEIHTDEHGRVRVAFHWDRGRSGVGATAHTSCWVRVSQTWSGPSWGFQFIPRIGMEVLVAFLDGDTDRPVVIGCLPNAVNPVPYALPAGASKSGIRTSSTPGGKGYNEIALDDAAGVELVSIRAQKDFAQETRDEHRLVVGGDRKAIISGSDSLQVAGGRQVVVSGDSHDEIAGHAEQLVNGNVSADVMGNRSAWIEGHDEATVRGNIVQTVSGDIALAANGNYILSAGTSDMGEVSINVSGNFVAGASQRVRILAQEAITIACGDSSITIGPDKITLESVNVEIKGAKGVTATGAGPSLSLADEAQLVAKKIAVISEGARIEMNKEASIKGEKVKLAGSSPPPEEKSEEQKEETEKLEVRYTDPNGEAYAKKKYRISIDGKILDGETDPDGKLSLDVAKTARVAEVRLWIDEYPEGRVKSYVIDLDREFPPPNEPRGAKARLKNLGFFGGVVDDSNDGLSDALLLFQEDRELEPTGKLDGTTADELKKAHGH